ncbi:hypothetical protein HRE53_27430 (plasmid) [Acaryochloris sp. 'Moss Beach']|uniref:hypothetical protein n=1 Tax=Acaryochloris sp. 'Moss Beach' TaxID=2740837 RepID=UPI001F372F39|nr:hypothetical protein [Acaryochloris sp. 'Moss Beach']UJB72326.1 hypothetical protein HRE53_27430 [Acaryochloris sp. 'Moss Beach']
MPSINDEDQSLDSITKGNRALELFTDRYNLTRIFLDRLNEDRLSEQVLFFYGAGGNGKSLLLKYLQRKCCRRLLEETWTQIKEYSNERLVGHVSRLVGGMYLPIPSALLDFGAKPMGIEHPQDRFYGPLILRRNLAESVSIEIPHSSIQFPLFDFACIWYLHKKGKSPEEIKATFPAIDITGLIASLITLVTTNPGIGISQALFNLVAKCLGQQFTVYKAQMNLSKEDFNDICSKDLDTELIEMLPGLLAQDLNAAMAQDNSPKRVVLFFDAHEAFWGNQRNLPNSMYFFRDEWLRRFLRSLDFASGIVVVIAGREIPQWPDAKEVNNSTDIPKKNLQLETVGHFSESDAVVYLIRVGIEDELLRQALIGYAVVQPEEIHPLYLGLGADVVLQAQVQEKNITAEDFLSLTEVSERGKVLIELLLKYVNSDIRDAIHCLSACRAFDYELYTQLGDALYFSPTYSNFEILTAFSFVWQISQRGRSYYRIHDLLRRLSYEGGEDRGRSAHKFLKEYYRSQADIAETIYHMNRLDPIQGVSEWHSEFKKALLIGQYEQCEALIKIREELISLDPFQNGLLSNFEGQYFAKLARYVEAEQAFSQSKDFYEVALEEAPDNIYIINNKVYTLQCMGNLYVDLAHYKKSRSDI